MDNRCKECGTPLLRGESGLCLRCKNRLRNLDQVYSGPRKNEVGVYLSRSELGDDGEKDRDYNVDRDDVYLQSNRNIVCTRLNDGLYVKALKAAKKDGKTVSEFMRGLVEKVLA